MQHFAKEGEILDHYQMDIATLIGLYFSIAKTDTTQADESLDLLHPIRNFIVVHVSDFQ